MKFVHRCLLITLLLAGIPAAFAQPSRTWDLGNFTQTGQITLFDAPMAASTTGKPVELGDFDGDGCGDVAITGQNARGGSGQTRLVFGLCEKWGSAFDLGEPQAGDPLVLNIYGAQPGDMLGTELSHADFNADGFDDLLVGAQNAFSADLTMAGAGAAYILFGSADLSQHATIEMNFPPENVLSIHGAFFEGRLGIWVEGGDFDGDGFHDALIGSNQADGFESRRPNAGEVYILYGAADMFAQYGAVVDLRNPPPEITTIIGADYDDLLGSTVYGADLNMDGRDDVIASAALWRGSAGVGGLAQGGGDGPANARYNAGDIYVIYGSPILRGATLDLQTMLDENGAPRDERLTVIYGAETNDFMGEELVVGDLNADGRNDLVVGSLAAPGRDNQRPDGGEAWIIYTDENFAGSLIDLAQAGAAVPVYAPEADSKGGDTMLIADMDQDGVNDLLYGMPNLDVRLGEEQVRENAGVLAILYGVEGGFPTTEGLIDFADPPPDLRYAFLLGADPFDMSAYGMALGDVDADGYPDIAMNGMNGDGPDNRRPDAGEIYIISGRILQAHQQGEIAAAPAPTSPATSAATPTPIPTFDPAATPLSLQAGEQLFVHNCAGCHGADGRGIDGIAVPLVGSEYFAPNTFSDIEIATFIRTGRTADDPNSKIGRPMPPSGGNPALTDAEILAIIAYVWTLQE